MATSEDNMDLAIVRRQTPGRTPLNQNGNAHSLQGQVVPFNSQIPGRNSSEQQPSSVDTPGEKEIKSSHRVHQNAMAILKYNKSNEDRTREGRHAATVDQMHQNDLHNLDTINEMPHQVKENTTLPVNSQQGTSFKNGYIQNPYLNTSFDPLKDRHMWTMWRTAVNGRIVDEVRRLEKDKLEKGTDSVDSVASNGVYGTALYVTPLKQFIKLDNDQRQDIPNQILSLGEGILQTAQFVYYGLPRVRMAHPK
uniref:Uncharacterized protein n=1 Tax=Arion vulgaris TaxID=1028688 RepID=A0A0B7A291_9EUPU